MSGLPNAGATNRPAWHSGFTLVELITIVALVGILAAVVAPRFFERSGFEARSFHDELVAALRYAQKHAVARGCPTQLRVTAAGFQMRRQADCVAGPFDTPVLHPARGAAFDRATPKGVTLTPATTLLFSALGTTSDATLSVQAASDSRSISVIGATGYVQAS